MECVYKFDELFDHNIILLKNLDYVTWVEELLIWFKKELVYTYSFTIYTEMKEGAGIDSLIYFKNIIIERLKSNRLNI